MDRTERQMDLPVCLRVVQMRAWDIYLWDRSPRSRSGVRRHVDTVFFDNDMREDEVRRSLVDHDGFNPAIELEWTTDEGKRVYQTAFE
jgi:hypothetical protein